MSLTEVLAEKFQDNPLGYWREGYLHVPYSDIETRALRWKAAHRLLADWMLRIPLCRGLHVHHRDGDRANNHVSNIVFGLDASQHTTLHAALRKKQKEKDQGKKRAADAGWRRTGWRESNGKYVPILERV